jgi:hypothetical protein
VCGRGMRGLVPSFAADPVGGMGQRVAHGLALQVGEPVSAIYGGLRWVAAPALLAAGDRLSGQSGPWTSGQAGAR